MTGWMLQRLKKLRPGEEKESFWTLLSAEFQPERSYDFISFHFAVFTCVFVRRVPPPKGNNDRQAKRPFRRNRYGRGDKDDVSNPFDGSDIARAGESTPLESLAGMIKPNQSDYSTVFLPWGPGW